MPRHTRSTSTSFTGKLGSASRSSTTGSASTPSKYQRAAIGLTGMQERARLIGADFHVSSRPGSTRVVLHLPLVTQDGGPADDLPAVQNQAVESAAGANAHRGIDEPGPAVSR